MKKLLLASIVGLTTVNISNAETYLMPIDNKHYDKSVVIQDYQSGENGNNNSEPQIPMNLSSCKALLEAGQTTDGIYTIILNSGSTNVYCDMTTDGGGWTLVSHIYDKDDRDDILNDSNGVAWGDPAVSPTDDSSFNIANSDTPAYTESKYDWRYPLVGDSYSHAANSALIDNRFAWGTFASVTLIANLGSLGVNNTVQDGRISGAFGATVHSNVLNALNTNHVCGGARLNNKSLHYWGWGSIIAYGQDSTYELHNNHNGVTRATTTSCGTKESILNIWVR